MTMSRPRVQGRSADEVGQQTKRRRNDLAERRDASDMRSGTIITFIEESNVNGTDRYVFERDRFLVLRFH